MNTHVRNVRNILRATILALALAALSLGCGSDESRSTGNDQDPIDYSPNVNDDIATIMSASLAADNGGIADQLVDIASLSLGQGLRATNLVTAVGGGTEPLTYNEGNGTWHWTLAREYSGVNGLYVARFERTYEWRYLKKNGQPQVAYVHNGDTAYTIELAILSGSGRHEMPLLSQTLTSLSARLVATGTNTDDIAVEGRWSRSALDTIRTRSAVRAIAHACSLSIVGMSCHRDSANVLWHNLTGAITASLTANIAFIEGDAYAENEVSRDLAIEIDSGMAAITVGDSTWNCELRHGVVQLPPDVE